MYESLIRRLLTETLIKIKEDSISEGEHWSRKAIEADQGNRMTFNLRMNYAFYARFSPALASDMLKHNR